MASLNLNLVVVTTIMVAYTHFYASMAITSWVIGGARGWDSPPRPNFYEEWVKEKKFVKGDYFYFIFKNHTHSFAEVEKSAFDTCNTTSIKDEDDVDTSGFMLIAQKAHTFYFVCKRHCKQGHTVVIDIKES
ncbi:early nodulin-like protein 9 [Bidens hawaiensis]|uniref:early nodulin-like protein 9 n=1 Tax=Bidens hawaiensis TaxID=980011 RepID=UPI00404A7186